MHLTRASLLALPAVPTIVTLFIVASTDAFLFENNMQLAGITFNRAQYRVPPVNVQLSDMLQGVWENALEAIQNPNRLGQVVLGQNIKRRIARPRREVAQPRRRRAKQRAPRKRKQPKKRPVGTARVMAERIVGLVNGERRKRGLKPLRENLRLSKVAEAKSKDMRDNKYFQHVSPRFGTFGNMVRKAGIKFSLVGENIAMGIASPTAVMKAWMNSPGHRRNILSPRVDQIGVGYASGGSGPYWTQEFIKQ